MGAQSAKAVGLLLPVHKDWGDIQGLSNKMFQRLCASGDAAVEIFRGEANGGLSAGPAPPMKLVPGQEQS
eukprot:Skav224435  [mRNA]  locus=scaffold3233:140954:141163:+ [translate_table: standard]